jgi:hypothetical protein
MIEGEFHQGMAAMNVQFLADIVSVSFYGADADVQLLRDLFIGFAIGD